MFETGFFEVRLVLSVVLYSARVCWIAEGRWKIGVCVEPFEHES